MALPAWNGRCPHTASIGCCGSMLLKKSPHSVSVPLAEISTFQIGLQTAR